MAALLAAVALGFWLRQDILGRSDGNMTWVVGRLGSTARPITISSSGTAMSTVPVLDARIMRFQEVTKSPPAEKAHGWLLICKWFYVGRHDATVQIH